MGAPLEQARKMPDHTALSRALGMRERVDVEVRREDACAGDLVLLCTDGLANVVTDEEIARVLAGWSDVEATVAALIGLAGARAAADDVTCVVVRWLAARESG